MPTLQTMCFETN